MVSKPRHPDGERLAVLKASGEADHVTLIVNFFEELRRIAPPGKGGKSVAQYG